MSETLSHPNTSGGGTQRRRIISTVLAAVAAIAVAFSGLVLTSPRAEAATIGYGYNTIGSALGYLGSVRINGGSELAYCIDIAAGNEGGTDAGPYNIDSWKATNANDRARVNWAVSTYGQSTDRMWAAAVQLYIWSIADTAYYNSQGGFGYYSWRAPAADRPTIQAHYNQLISEGSAITAGATGSGSATLTLTVNPANNYIGTLAVSTSPTNATGTIVLTNGVFDATGTNTIAGVGNGQVLAIRGVPPVGDPIGYKISANGTFSAPGGWSSTLRTWMPSNGQRLTSTNGRINYSFNAATEDPTVRGVQFLPALTTQVSSKIVEIGDTFGDNVTFATVADDEGTNNPWFQESSGAYSKVYAVATVYGPFTSQPEQSSEVPLDAPVAGTVSFVANGPGTYPVNSTFTADTTGFYTWVWSIDWHEQTVANGASVSTKFAIPGPSAAYPDQEPYLFVDDFGQVAETSIVPSGIFATSQVTAEQVAIGDEITDVLTVGSTTDWLLGDDGERIPVVFRGTPYFVTGADAPVQASTVPAEALALGTVFITADAPGEYTSPSLTAPIVADGGWISWVWEIRPEDQPAQVQGYVGAWSDEFGIPAETQQVISPTVTTQAQPGAKLGEEITDTAIIDGPIPADGAELTFELFEVPLVGPDADGRYTPAYPAGVDAGDFSWVCTADNLVFTTAPVAIAEDGEYESEGFAPDDYGRYVWVETLTAQDGNGGTVVLARDDCGIAEETSFIVDVTTRAVTNAPDITTPILWDTASIIGYVPDGGTVTFSAYRQADGELPKNDDGRVDYSAVCSDDTLVFTSEPVDLGEGGSTGSCRSR